MHVGNLICHKNKRMQVDGPSQDFVLHPSREHTVGIKKKKKKNFYENIMKSTFYNAAILKTVQPSEFQKTEP